MPQRSHYRLLFTALAAIAPLVELGAQSRTQPAIPNTAAGAALRAYVDTSSTLDTTRLRNFVRRYRPEVQVDMDRERAFFERTGGFDLVTIERSEPRHIEFTTRERKSGMGAYGAIDVSDSPRPVITNFNLTLGVTADAVRIDAKTRSHVIATIASALDSAYVFPKVARRMSDTLRGRFARGVYDRETTGFALAFRVTTDMTGVSHDKHLALVYRPIIGPRPPPGPTPQPTPPGAAPSRPMPAPSPSAGPSMDARQCGFQQLDILNGSIGYLKLNRLADPTRCESAAIAVMDSLAPRRALIIDLRDNIGGSPQMIALLASYLFDRKTHLNDMWERASGRTAESWTRDTVPGRRFGGHKPVYVLTSSRTFSGGEEFAYDLKQLKRALIVGETTRGGAHLTMPQQVDEHFTLSLPFARAINPVTHTDWEGVGVEPDVKVDAADALQEALQRIGRAP